LGSIAPETLIQLRNIGRFGLGGIVLAGKMMAFYTVGKPRPYRHRDGSHFLGGKEVV
jgi:hypothetical protein